VAVASSLLGVRVHVHERNVGYGGNKTCYRLHWSGRRHCYHASSRLPIHAEADSGDGSIIANGLHPCVLGSRILAAIHSKAECRLEIHCQPFSDFGRECFAGAKLSEYHTGYRAFSRELLEKLDLSKNSDDFVFDNQMLAQIFWHGFTIGEVSCPTKYFPEGVLDQFPPQPQIRLWLSCHRIEIPSGENGWLRSELFSSTRGEARLLPVDGGAGSTPDLTALSNAEWTRQKFDRFVLFAGGEQRAIIFFQTGKRDLNAAIVLVLRSLLRRRRSADFVSA